MKNSYIFWIWSIVILLAFYKQNKENEKYFLLLQEKITENKAIIEENVLYTQYLEQLIPEIQKKNLKIKALKSIVDRSFKDTKENHFKSEREYNDFILSVVDFSDLYKVPSSLILAVSRVESNFNPRATSETNAQGMMQIMPDTTKFCVKSLNKTNHDPFYARDSVQCGAWYLRQMMNIFKDDEMVIRAYNVGPSFLLKYQKQELPSNNTIYFNKVYSFFNEYRSQLRWEN